jgi:hypothetical protein
MIRCIPIIILIYVSVSAAWCGVDAAFALLEARGWGFGRIFLALAIIIEWALGKIVGEIGTGEKEIGERNRNKREWGRNWK